MSDLFDPLHDPDPTEPTATHRAEVDRRAANRRSRRRNATMAVTSLALVVGLGTIVALNRPATAGTSSTAPATADPTATPLETVSAASEASEVTAEPMLEESTDDPSNGIISFSDPASGPLVIGDTLILSARNELSELGYRVDGYDRRQLADAPELVRRYRATNQIADDDTVVIELGTNGPFTDAEYEAVLDELAAVPNVVVFTSHVDRAWTADNNAIIYAHDLPDDNVYVFNWAAIAERCPGQCFEPDGIHLAGAGVDYLVDQLSEITGR